jgi:chorismate synthase
MTVPFRFLTAGESHGRTLGVTVEGVPSGLALAEADLVTDLARRQRGYGRGARQQIEHDRAEIVAGVRHGRTLGSPILLLVANRDWENWTQVMAVEGLTDEAAAELAAKAGAGDKKATPVTRVRPGHGDLAGALKYDHADVRNVLERASARETAARVAAGGVARAFLRELGIDVWSFTAEVGGVAVDPARASRSRDEADASPLRCPDPDAEAAMIARIDEAREAGDTVGGVFEVVATGVPIGFGSYVHWDRRLDAALAAAVMSINIVKGVELGLGFEQTRRFGSQVHDVIEGRGEAGRWIHRSNNAGGLTAGVSNGEPIVVRGAVKPISTLARPLPSADLLTGGPVEKAHYERSDISVVPAAGVVGEAMVMLTLATAILEKLGGDSMSEVTESMARWRERLGGAPGGADAPSDARAARAHVDPDGGTPSSGGDD